MSADWAERVSKAEEERDRYRRLYHEALERCRMLERGILGKKSERMPADDSQLSLQVLGTMLREFEAELEDPPEPEAAEPQQIAAHTRRKSTGRQVLPEHLPRVEIEVIPDEVQREGLDAFERIGEEVAEVLEHRPSSMVVVVIRRPKFVRKDRERNVETTVLQSEPADLPIERGMAGPGLLADTIVRRWADHLPLNRLEKIYEREGVHLARSTVCGWHERLAELLRPLIDAMWADAMASPYLCTDATGVLVQALEKCRHGNFWVVVAPEKHVLFRYSAKHDKEAVQRNLGTYEGYLVADAHAVYDHLYVGGKITEVACWAHTRRYFFKAMLSEPELARQGLVLIGQLFRHERELADKPAKQRKKARQAKSKPVVEAFFRWCEQQMLVALDDTPLAKGLGYALNQRVALTRFLDDGRLPLDNNISERELRREAVGRKNWLFVGSDEAGEINAAFVTLLASCQMHGLEPWSYLRDLLCILPRWPQSRILELAPAYWRESLEKQEAQRLLEGTS
ncbi:MAG: IS66 family transposase, partial [Acidobacteria bacterium]|nr:IS66 family transposase [Acidobacteriota bacterium]